MHAPVAPRAEGRWLDRFWSALNDPVTSPTHYWAAPAAVGLMLLLGWGLHPWLQDRASFVIFVPAVLIAAGFGGLAPGLLATALSVVLGVLLVGGVRLTGPVILEAIVFAIVGAGISFFGEQLRRTRIRSRRHAKRLESARGASSLDPRYGARCHHRHRREGHDPVLQRRGGAPVRLSRSCGRSAAMSAC